MIGLALVFMAVLYLIVQRTKMGTAMRAVSEDGEAAALMGIDVNKVVVFTFMLGGAMAGIAGVFYAFVYKQVYFFMGFTPGIKAFGAAVLGGIGNIPGAMLGGFFLGMVESVGPTLFLDGIGIPAPYQLRDLIAFTLLIMVLIFRPQGLLGEKHGEEARMIRAPRAVPRRADRPGVRRRRRAPRHRRRAADAAPALDHHRHAQPGSGDPGGASPSAPARWRRPRRGSRRVGVQLRVERARRRGGGAADRRADA